MSSKLPMPKSLTCTIFVSLLALSCGKGAPEASTDKQSQAKQQQGTAGGTQAQLGSFQSRKDKLSYAFGVDMARTIQREKDRLNVELLRSAMSDALADKKLLMTDDEVNSTLKTFEAELRQDLQHARVMLAERNRKEAEAFFAENAKKDGVVTLPTGLQYKVLTKGTGEVPSVDDVVVCSYRGKLLDGTEIDGSDKQKGPTAVPVKKLIGGFAQALQLMPVGSKWQIFVPPHLAYGDRAMPSFGPNSALIFDVELFSIKEKKETASIAK